MSSRSSLRPVALAASTLATAVLLSGCSIPANVFSGDAERNEKGAVTADSKIDIFELKVGDCKLADDASSTELSDTNVVPCDDPHDEEIFYEFDLPEGEFPAADVVEKTVWETCDPQFEAFVGLSEADSTLTYAYFSPTKDGWEQLDDRTIQCVLFSEEGTPLEGSAKGTKI
ncbi:septum formation family protein [Microbacterium sp. NPDC089321]|uniref:septum formation family protein n=1 Tax=Microbacterium sp. NPDC089321 TaxID=3155183 RepID=UPI0034449F23